MGQTKFPLGRDDRTIERPNYNLIGKSKMYISKVSLVNYRNFTNESFEFHKGINTIIGENGAGKTNVFRAMRLLLEDSSYQFAYKLSENDFNRKIGDWRGHWIIISVEFDDITDDEAIQSLFIHGSGIIDDKDFVKKACYNLFFRPKADIRLKLSELKEGDHKGLEGILSTITIQDNYETVFTGKSIADFTDEKTYNNLVGDFKEVKFNFEIDTAQYGIKIPHQLSVAKEISFTFIQALRDVVSDFHDKRRNPLLSLLKSKSGEIKESDYAPIIGLVNELNSGIETLPDVQKIREDIKDTIKDTVGRTYSPSSLSIQSSLSEEADKLLQSLQLFIGEPDESYEGGIHELSLGGANLIFLTLKLLEYKYQKSKETFANFLIIEEPEAHIHTHIQKTLFDNLDYSDTQIIYSTHSTHISEVSNVSNINILVKKQNHAEVYQPSTGLKIENINKIQRYLDAIRSNLLFAKGVILVEGDAEEILIPLMVKKAIGISLDELGISLINIRSTGFENVAQLFHDKRIKRRCSILTDLDDAICDTSIKPEDSEGTKKYKKKVQNSKKKGLERKKSLDKFAKNNPWVEPFYANYTFEVDFVENGNEWEVEQLLDSVYTDEKTKEKTKKELNSGDVSLYGKRVLTMAKQEGKGWFAVMLGEHVQYLTNIPDYIIKAIIFARTSFSTNLICNIIEYRIAKYYEDDTKLDFSEFKQTLSGYKDGNEILAKVVNEIEAIIPDDQITKFLKIL
jgi:predicted ATP-dependent endonuclease of OLD family